MKDIKMHISVRRQHRELLTFAVCFAVAFLLNVYAIAAYDAPWSELLTSIFYVITMAVVLYAAWSCVRLVVWALFKKKRNPKIR